MKKKMVVHGDTPFLPDKIITNILKRLRVKPLIRYQNICKHWKNLLKSPSFIADHRHHSSNQDPYLLFQRRVVDPLNLFVVDYEMQTFLDIQKPPSLLSNLCRASIIGSCNGLTCVQWTSYGSSGTSLFIWNPATREVRCVLRVIDDVDCIFYFGFGFCPILNDNKIVKISMPNVTKRVEVYSLNKDSWKEIEFKNMEEGVRIFWCNASINYNGSIFWYALKLGVMSI